MSDWDKQDPFTPIYRRLERDFIGLAEHVWMDDSQRKVYSPAAADIVVRAVAEIETISKRLYRDHCPQHLVDAHAAESNNGSFPLFDKVCLDKFLLPDWDMKERAAVCSKQFVFWDDYVVRPFSDALIVQRHGRSPTWSWNAAYQSLKHDRANEMTAGTVEHALQALAAAFLLRLYWIQPNLIGAAGSEARTDFGSELFMAVPYFDHQNPTDEHRGIASLVFEKIPDEFGGSRTYYEMRLNTGVDGPILPEAQLVAEGDEADG